MLARVPNFLYIGTSKAGSTWVYDLLNRHPDIYMAPGKATIVRLRIMISKPPFCSTPPPMSNGKCNAQLML